jgi:GTPase KRas protein
VLDILDTASASEEYPTMRDQHYRTGQGFILMYSVLSRQSFFQIPQFIDEIFHIKVIQFLIAFNRRIRKTFLLCSVVINLIMTNHNGKLVIKKVAILQDAMKFHFMLRGFNKTFPAFDVYSSAKTRTNLEEPFYDCVREIRRVKTNIRGKSKKGKNSKELYVARQRQLYLGF